jgi:hypothetical protein
MSRGFLLSLIFGVAVVLAWFGYEEVQRSRTLTTPTNEIVKLPETTSTVVTENENRTLNAELSATSSVPPLADNLTANPPSTQAVSNDSSSASNDAPSSTETSPDVPAATQTEATTTPSDTAPALCLGPDEAGLLAAFDNALAAFLSDATALYGNQYENLQYELSSKQSVINGEQGVVTTTYSGTVTELDTGQAVSASGTITATFTWDSCAWQLMDYSF